jgi:nicotinate-nucleotide pyrophosphorylase (carboxylating)
MDWDVTRSAMPLDSLLRWALLEDLPHGDLTTEACLPGEVRATGSFVAKSEQVVAATAATGRVFTLLDPALVVSWEHADGERVPAGTVLGSVSGSARSILAAERTALNLMQRMSGIATLTRRIVEAVEGTRARVLDTRKTTPGWRLLEKQAVLAGGGVNHRFCLSDAVLIKTNHIRLAGGMTRAMERARARAGHLRKIEVEAHDLASLEQALAGGADVVLLDNMSVETVREAVQLAAGRAVLEVSGGLNAENVAAYARTGVDFLSLGALTHSASASDISLRLSEDKSA